VLNEALNYLKEGLSVIPVRGPHYSVGITDDERAKSSKTSLISWLPYQKRLPEEDEVRQWFTKWPKANIACITWKISGIAVVDFDSTEAVQTALRLRLLNTPTVKTARGVHAYYKYPSNKIIRNVANEKTKIDIRGEGGIIILPPSLHMSGHRYEWVYKKRLGSMPLMELPDIFLEEGNRRERGSNNYNNLKTLYKGVKQGERNHTLARLCGSWFNDGLTPDECLQMAIVWNMQNEPPMERAEIETTIKSIMRYRKGTKNPERNVFYSGYSIFSMPLFACADSDYAKKNTIRYKISDSHADRIWIVTNNEKHGACNVFDDAVFMAINKIVLDAPLQLKNPVNLGAFESIAKIIKINKPTAEDYRKIKKSIKKLASVFITSIYINKDTEGKNYIESNFRIFDKVVYDAGNKNSKGNYYGNYIWLSDTYLKCINNGYLPTYDLDKYLSLKEGTARALYKLLSVQFQSEKTKYYKTSFANLREYLSLSNNEDKARTQLAKAHAELKRNQIIDDMVWQKGLATYIKPTKKNSATIVDEAKSKMVAER